ncbi:MAG: xanthine dehydrogenase family protein [Actinobacteria bacterium]|nr:xanthine dehydrogenase family protein [Actinomycetota bacterium]
MSTIGVSVPRIEDERLLRGEGRFVDDLRLAGALEVAFLRSPHAHARIGAIDAAAALALPGVVAVIDGRETAAALEPMVFDIAKIVPEAVREATAPAVRVHPMPALPTERVTYVGQPVAMVVAESRYLAEDAVDLLAVEFEPLPAVVDAERALAPGAPRVETEWEDNEAISFAFERGDVDAAFAAAKVVVEESFRSHRQHPSPIETRGVAAGVDPQDGSLDVWSATQTPHLLRDFLARWLGRDPERIRVRAPDVGGAFGIKHSCYPEDLLIPFAALRLGRAVKWTEDRAEHLAAATQGRDQVHRIAVAADAAGRILAVRDHAVMNAGAFNLLGLVVPYNTFTHLLGPYDVGAFGFAMRVAVTNTAPVAPYRGAGRPEAVFAIERAIDRLARELGADPADVRARNLIGPEQMPYETGIVYRDGTDQVYDSGDYPELLRRAREVVERERFEAAATERRRIGVGYAIYTEGTGVGPFETARVRIEPTGRVKVLTGASSQGQGHRTTLAQLAAEALGVAVADVEVVGGDSAAVPSGFGTLASRTLVVAGNAVSEAAAAVRAQALEVAAGMLGAASYELEIEGGTIAVRGRPDATLPLGAVADFLTPFNPARPRGAPSELAAESVYRPGPVTWSAGVHVAVVAVDLPTGVVEVLRFVVAHDCGRVVNPAIVDGQIVGGVMQGIGGALHEEVLYDEDGQLRTGNFMDYVLPTAGETPEFELIHLDTPSPLNPLGVKGMGEGGAIGPPAAIAGAVEDALADLGVVVHRGPLGPSRVRDLIVAAAGG